MLAMSLASRHSVPGGGRVDLETSDWKVCRTMSFFPRVVRWVAPLTLIWVLSSTSVDAACCYFAAKDKDIDQPGQKAFITWEPAKGLESFTVQPKFEGDARDFGMVVPSPGQPKLDEMPRDFFKHLAVYTILQPIPQQISNPLQIIMYKLSRSMNSLGGGGGEYFEKDKSDGPAVVVLEEGVVGSLDYKIIRANDATGLFEWLKLNQYSYAGDEETLDYYIQKDWFFTVMKIDTNQMMKGPGGEFRGEVTPTRFTFQTKELVYPLKITAISVKTNTEALFYVQGPEQMDLQGSWSWQWSYRVMWLNSGTVCLSQKQMTSEERDELAERQQQIEKIRQEIPGYDTTKLEWSRKLDDLDAKLLDDPLEHYAQYGRLDWPEDAQVVSLDSMKKSFADEARAWLNGAPPNETLLNSLDGSYSPDKGIIVKRTVSNRDQFHWMPNREAPPEDVQGLRELRGHIRPGLWLTKFRKSFMKGEMVKDLVIEPVPEEKRARYHRVLPQSPP